MSSDTGSNEDTLESIEGVDYETPFSTPASSPPLGNSITHDTSRTKYHMKDLESFAAGLENSAKRAFPNRDRATARYKNVQVLLFRWAEDDLGVDREVADLEKTFKSYGFNAETWLIPSENSHLELMLKTGNFLKTHESKDTLFIVYYGGHATINRRRQSTWSCKRNWTYATLEWSAIQIVFEKARSDVLLLLDCCSAASAAPIAGRAITETIAACGWESIAAEPGRFSFTNTLIEVLEEWINRPFTAAMLHCEILSRLKHENPELRGNQRVEFRRTPIYIVTTGDLSASSIYLAKMDTHSKSGTYSEHDSNPPMESIANPASNRFEDMHRMADTTADGTLKTPHVLISLALEEGQILDADACARWLASFPALAKYANVQGVFKSHSTLMLVSLPVMIWDLLPDNPACSFIGYVCSHNLLESPGSKQKSATAETKNLSYAETGSESKVNFQRLLADINVYEAFLNDMAASTLDKDFKDELNAIEQWLRVLSDSERTAALYALLQQSTQVQTEFLTLVLQQIENRPPRTFTSNPALSAKTGTSGLAPSTIAAVFPDAVAAIEAEKSKLTGIPKAQRPTPSSPKGLPLLKLPRDTNALPKPRDISPFHSSASGSIYSTSSFGVSRNDMLWASSRGTTISTATDWPTPVSGSHWSPTGVVATPQEMGDSVFDEADWSYKVQPTSPTATRQHLGVPGFGQKGGSLTKHSTFNESFPPANKAEHEYIAPRPEDRHGVIYVSDYSEGVAVQAHLHPGIEENWISPRLVERLKLSPRETVFERSHPWDPKWGTKLSVFAKWRDTSKTRFTEYNMMFLVAQEDSPFEVVLGRRILSSLDDIQAKEIYESDQSHHHYRQQSIRDSELGEM